MVRRQIRNRVHLTVAIMVLVVAVIRGQKVHPTFHRLHFQHHHLVQYALGSTTTQRQPLMTSMNNLRITGDASLMSPGISHQRSSVLCGVLWYQDMLYSCKLRLTKLEISGPMADLLEVHIQMVTCITYCGDAFISMLCTSLRKFRKYMRPVMSTRSRKCVQSNLTHSPNIRCHWLVPRPETDTNVSQMYRIGKPSRIKLGDDWRYMVRFRLESYQGIEAQARQDKRRQ